MQFHLRNPIDGRVHFSDLKAFALSPRHARAALESPKEPTLAMRKGTAIDRVLLGGKLIQCDVDRGTKTWTAIALMAQGQDMAIYPGAVRSGKEWTAFQAANPDATYIATQKEFDVAYDLLKGDPCDLGSIVTPDEYALAKGAAEAVANDPVVLEHHLLEGERQRVIHWEAHGLPFAAGIAGVRGGFDVLGVHHLADLKGTSSTDPEVWMRHAEKMLYHAQLACYGEGAEYIGRKPESSWLIGVEFKPPHAVVCLRASSSMLEKGRRTIAAWCERLRECEATDHWPGYTQAPVEWEPNEQRYAMAYGPEGDDDG